MKKLIFVFLILSAVLINSETILNREYKMFSLDNGLQVIMIKTGSEPIFTIEIAVRNGAYTQTPENCGLSHLYEHMFFKGNAKWKTQEEYAKRIRELGIIYNGMTSNEAVRYFFTLPSKRAEEGMEFMAYAIMEPIFDTIELAKERNVVLNEFNRDFSEPSYIFYQAVEEAMYSKFFYRKNAIGSKDVIANATQAQMFEIKDKYYIPNNSALIIAGDIDFKKTEQLVKKYFSKWEKKDAPSFKFEEHPMLDETERILTVEDVSITDMMLMYRGPDVGKDNEKTYSMDILSEILKLKSGALYKQLVETGLANGYYAGYYTEQDGAAFTFYAKMNPENADTVKKIFLNEIKRMSSMSYFTEELLNQAKDKIEMNFYQETESSVDFTLGVGYWWCLSEIDYFMNYLENIKKVSGADIAHTVNAFLNDKPYIEGILTNEESAKKYFNGNKETK